MRKILRVPGVFLGRLLLPDAQCAKDFRGPYPFKTSMVSSARYAIHKLFPLHQLSFILITSETSFGIPTLKAIVFCGATVLEPLKDLLAVGSEKKIHHEKCRVRVGRLCRYGGSASIYRDHSIGTHSMGAPFS